MPGRGLPLPIPDLRLRSVYELSPARLIGLGIDLLLMDLDNTLSAYGSAEPEGRLRAWLDSLTAAGIRPHIFSNNRGARPARFAASLGIGATGRAKKPNPRVLLSLLDEMGVDKSRAALVGDQIYTDILCARRAGIFAISVRPVCMRAPHRAIRYAAEAPFRLAARRK